MRSLVDTDQVEAILALSAESREEVDDLPEKALASGGAPASEPTDMGFMYSRSFQDTDGRVWEIFWMDPVAVEQEAERLRGGVVRTRPGPVGSPGRDAANV